MSASDRVIALVCTAMLATPLAGCFRAVNVPLERYDPDYGYRPAKQSVRRDRGEVIYVAVSGGGTRAAALAYGVLEALRDTVMRSDLAKRVYHETVFDRATFQTLTEARGPKIYINATDLSSGERFTFVQAQFDVICSDLHELPIAYAVAASSAVPVLLSPISMRNHSGSCGYEPPPWLGEALAARREQPRRYRIARTIAELADPEKS